mmetsp:Transcript_54450/g.127125  ORF Transcript_54450/g.127125 Transcript_54450/m.127125 type:complete len:185 (-) Transcript_54450:80-634(-)
MSILPPTSGAAFPPPVGGPPMTGYPGMMGPQTTTFSTTGPAAGYGGPTTMTTAFGGQPAGAGPKWTNDDAFRYGEAKTAEKALQDQQLWQDKVRYEQMVWQQQNAQMYRDWQERQQQRMVQAQQEQYEAMFPGFYGGKGGAPSPYAYPGDTYQPSGPVAPRPAPPPGYGDNRSYQYGRKKKGCC